MSGAEIALVVIPLVPIGLAYALKLHRAYKKEKKGIYFMIRKGLAELDFDMVAEWAGKLKSFDEKHTNLLTGLPNKSITQKLLRKNKNFKLDDVERLFNVSKDVILDATKMKQQFSQVKSFDKANQILNKIEEEEQKENVVLSELKNKLGKIKRKQIATNNKERMVIDSFNLTDKINEINKEYEDLFIKTFEEERDLQNILQRGMKKQALLKRMKQIKHKKPQKQGVSC